MSFQLPIQLAGQTFLADLSGAIHWAEESTLIVSDLHLEKGSSFGVRGGPRFLPPYDTRETILRLQALIERRRPDRVVCLGDSLHDPAAGDRIDPEDSGRIAAMTRDRDWIWIAGNHDPEPPSQWGGRVFDEIAIGPVVLRHRAAPTAPAPGCGEISGHYHPSAAISTRAARVSGRCFAADSRRLVLPAFGAYTGGLSVLTPAIRSLFGDEFRVVMMGRRRLFGFSSRNLIG